MGGKFDDAPLMPGSVWFRLLACTTAIFFFAARLEEGDLEPTLGMETMERLLREKKSPRNSGNLMISIGGGFKDFLFSPLLGEMIQFDDHIFQMG